KDVEQWFEDRLQSKLYHDRSTAAGALARVGKRAEPLAPKVRPLLNDRAVDVRVLAAVSLWEITGRSEGAVDALKASLHEKPASITLVPTTRGLSHYYGALGCLGAMGESAREAAGDVAQFLKDRDSLLSVLAARAL